MLRLILNNIIIVLSMKMPYLFILIEITYLDYA